MGAAVMAGASIAAQLGGQLLQARGQYQAGLAEEAQLRQNRALAELEAQDALKRGEVDAQRVLEEGRQVQGQAKAVLGASGAVATSGSALDVLVDTRLFSERDAAQVRANAQREAWGYRVQGAQLGFAETVARKRRQAGLTSSILGGIGTAVVAGMTPPGAGK